MIIIPYRHAKLFLSDLFKTPRRHRSGREVAPASGKEQGEEMERGRDEINVEGEEGSDKWTLAVRLGI